MSFHIECSAGDLSLCLQLTIKSNSYLFATFFFFLSTARRYFPGTYTPNKCIKCSQNKIEVFYLCFIKKTTVYEPGANNGPRPAFSTFTMNSNDISFINSHPLAHIFTKG